MQQPAYKIEIGVTPSSGDNSIQPYYWVLYAYYGNWCNEAAGWAKTPELAWEEAYHFFVRYKKSDH
ncbi:hypothetical protein [Brevibacillus invocatus]|uniref:hypothetical protein n=1 Tax=Brevibacillus invocatus TaxID=173959 RepID=UPI00203CC604|nr:hypothetical protein [Brevibacillus invocatus]MCM3078540.1 hypothetical protein [Brevibacillus invocatus]MCM3429209.1 hypothetical protein [Brevibacillus invocatus]